MKYKCPSCETEIFNRAQRLCRVCGFTLPAELLLSEAEIRGSEKRAEQERKANCAVDVGLPDVPSIPPGGL